MWWLTGVTCLDSDCTFSPAKDPSMVFLLGDRLIGTGILALMPWAKASLTRTQPYKPHISYRKSTAAERFRKDRRLAGDPKTRVSQIRLITKKGSVGSWEGSWKCVATPSPPLPSLPSLSLFFLYFFCVCGGGQRSMSGVFLYLTSPYFFEAIFHWTWLDQTGEPASPGPSCLPFSSGKIID